MSKLLDTPTHAFPPAIADKIAAQVQADDPDWTYIVVHDPHQGGLSIIAIYDEAGEYIGKL